MKTTCNCGLGGAECDICRIQELEVELGQQRTRAEAAEAELAEVRSAAEDAAAAAQEAERWKPVVTDLHGTVRAMVNDLHSATARADAAEHALLVTRVQVAAAQALDDLCRMIRTAAGGALVIRCSVDAKAVDHVVVSFLGEQRARPIGRGPTALEDALGGLLRDWCAERSAIGRALVGAILGDHAVAEDPRA